MLNVEFFPHGSHGFSTPSEFFHWDQMRIPVACNEKESVRSVRSVWETKKEAGRMSKHPFRAMNWQCWMMSDELIPDVPSDYSGLHPADALSLVSDARRLGLLQAYILVSSGSVTALVGVVTTSGSATTLAGVVSTSGILPGIRVGIRGGAIP